LGERTALPTAQRESSSATTAEAESSVTNISTSQSCSPGRLLRVRDKKPFEAVVAEHAGTVLRVCRAVLAPADADDAWSETFLSALEAYPRLPADANVEAWLVTISHRKAIDVARRSAKRAVPVAELPNRPEAPAPERDLDLTRSLDALPNRQRDAVVYHYLAGLPYKNVAAVIGGSPDAARRAASDGIASLRRTSGRKTARKGPAS
jgi:RNA polymerase sigma factor (sigma-70 family)